MLEKDLKTILLPSFFIIWIELEIFPNKYFISMFSTNLKGITSLVFDPKIDE